MIISADSARVPERLPHGERSGTDGRIPNRMPNPQHAGPPPSARERALPSRGRRACIPALLAVSLLIGATACGGPVSGPAAAAGSSGLGEGLMARRADFEQTVLLTGEVEAVRSIPLVVPETPSWRVELRWLAEDGAMVEAGERVAELDDTEFVEVLEENELTLEEELADLERQKAETASTIREKEFEVTRNRAEVEKAELEANLPEGIVPRQELADRRLALARAQSDLEKAEAELVAERQSSAAQLEIQRIEIDKARREIEAARQAIDELALEAPVAGLFLVAELPWEDRALQEGDTVWTGLAVGSIPDLSSLQVAARLSDVDDGRIAVGMPARVVLDAYPERVIEGEVAEVASIAREEGRDSLRRSFRVVVTLAETDPERMIPGMSARVEVISGRREGALVVPRQTVIGAEVPVSVEAGPAGEAGSRVLRADGEEVVVRLGACNAVVCVVEGGLEERTPLAAVQPGLRRPGGRSGSVAAATGAAL